MSDLYHTDHYKWLTKQVALLASKQFNELDLDNLLEELEMGIKGDLREFRHRLETLIAHLLKMNYQTTVLKDACSNYFIKKWIGTIKESRKKINELITENYSLKNYIEEAMVVAYVNAKEQAIDEMNIHAASKKQRLDNNSLPNECPWDFDKLMETEWYPLNGVEI
ncbi:DUF29 domain-containing protein [Endozoicomonas sp. ONNA1]|uniref:DUF29 domain-containing protein n=1 Tax=Endozoicomonas sp. ONNA1 TaxID=2828740 RepID=UPI0021481858|nr:DUF29 domain-containing protein [Endozoicomonas sp. ONNA1]